MKNKSKSCLLAVLLLTALLFTAIPASASVMADSNLTEAYSFDSAAAGNIGLYANWKEINYTVANTVTPYFSWVSYDAYIGGYQDGTVRPNAKITREEVAQIFYNLMASREYIKTTENSFSDLASNRWSNTAISTLASIRILSGYSDGTFMPGKEMTRAEFVKIASSFMGLKYINNSEYPFRDISEHWALGYILHAENEGWVSGYSDGTFKPDQSITRAEAIKITNALSGREAGHIDRIENMKRWLDNADESTWYYADIQVATNSYDMAPRS